MNSSQPVHQRLYEALKEPSTLISPTVAPAQWGTHYRVDNRWVDSSWHRPPSASTCCLLADLPTCTPCPSSLEWDPSGPLSYTLLFAVASVSFPPLPRPAAPKTQFRQYESWRNYQDMDIPFGISLILIFTIKCGETSRCKTSYHPRVTTCNEWTLEVWTYRGTPADTDMQIHAHRCTQTHIHTKTCKRWLKKILQI